MAGVITGFGVIASIIAVGYLLGRWRLLGDSGQEVLTRLSFYVATPALLFHTLATSDLSILFSPALMVTAASTVIAAGLFVAVGAVYRWGLGRTTLGALCSSYVNSGNLGIPIAVYVLGNASLVAPVLLFQQLIVTPIALSVLDLSRAGGRISLVQRVTAPLRNPVAVGSLTGVVVAAAGWRLPAPILEPATLVGGMSVPAVLLSFGMSLRGSALPGRGAERVPVWLSVALKSGVQPVAAWLIATLVFGLTGPDLLAVVVTSSLPAAQNLFTYAVQYDTAKQLTRESILLSTIFAAPVLALVAALLG